MVRLMKSLDPLLSSRLLPLSTLLNTAHFLQTDDLKSIDPLVLNSMCAADFEEYVHIAEYAWLMNKDTLHASIDWHERRRNVANLDLMAVTVAPLPTGGCCFYH